MMSLDAEATAQNMHIINSYVMIYRFSQFLGVAPYSVKIIKGQKILCESKFYNICAKIIYLYYVLFGVYNLQFVLRDLFLLKNLWSIIFYSLEIFTAYINFLSTPIIFLKYSKHICIIQNRLNELFTSLISEKNEKIKGLKNTNYLLFGFNIIFIVIIFFSNWIDFTKRDLEKSFLKNLFDASIHVPVILMMKLPSLHYVALANVIRLIYFDLNKYIRSGLGWLEIRNVRNIENILKDIFEDVNFVFSFTIFIGIFQTFAGCVSMTVLLITERSTIFTLDFLAWIISYVYYFVIITCSTSLVAEEVRKVDELKLVKF